MNLPTTAPFDDNQRANLSTALTGLNHDQKLWLSGFLAGLQAESAEASTPATAVAAAPAGKTPLTIVYGSESGNCENLAQDSKKLAAAQGFQVTVKDMGDLTAKDLPKAENLLVLVSTWGEGDPPDRAGAFYEEVMGDGAPKLENVRFSVLALGDTSYEHFCKIGKDFDLRLENLGAQRFHPRTDCDVDYDEPYKKWIDGALHDLSTVVKPASNGVAVGSAAVVAPAAPAIAYGKKNAFPSELKNRVLLNGRGSAKETLHFELSLEGSGLKYDAGDALALIPKNCPDDVNAVVAAGKFDPEEAVPAPDGSEGPLREVLFQYYDITGLTKPVLKKYNSLAKSSDIEKLLADDSKEKLKEYLWGRQVVDALTEFPVKGVSGRDFVSILRKMPPRLYSIASSMKAHPDEVHLTIAAVRYDSHGRSRKGVASTYIADRVALGETVPVYTHANKNFKLPASGDTPVIMVGPGTGVAPFRSFVEDRQADGAKGKNWLFFGDQHYSYDFLYQLEWQEYLKDGVLDRLDVAFSRDQKQKIYVQQRMLERSKELYGWLEEGAHFYVCGDASRMAGDVHEALISIVQKEGAKSPEDAEAYVKDLQKSKRYQRDVY
ncbi:assimilatory sulfite reductase (NADPH) flavoprotein subunit [Rubellicoccus peritrichatus]|uniref:assimilatory sulfite reductase (NADPH) n=1 Tax=Rubellicoccus peritrichatus TaxID=3080537 RepID=A0AAQ3L9V9_9BACT|nr:assimilatory sulfite reductase (NADPH) flavoprotein subunit [Puniceicoccus sp. CR14]WOO40015.1 assimilatory sulfite reductase (NADPH) flavoprotein subunit [Puniceicoccus sp. CR14]